MGMHYRSESSSSLTNEQIDNNFRHLTGSKSITGSYAISGNLLPSDPSGSLGSNEQSWKDLYLSPDSIVFASGSVSHTLSYPIEPWQQTPDEMVDEVVIHNTQTEFFEDVFSNIHPDSLNPENEYYNFRNTPIQYSRELPLYGPTTSSNFPLGVANSMVSWWYSKRNLLNNGGGFSIGIKDIKIGADWLDRSRHYATDRLFLSGSYSGSIGHLQNANPKYGLTVKTSVLWDKTRPHLFTFSNQAGRNMGGANFAIASYAHPNGPQNIRSYYYNLLVSGSAYEIDPATSKQVLNDLEPPPYDDGDILVRIWNDNVTYFSYFAKLEYDSRNVVHYNISQSQDPLSNNDKIYYQSSINPGRVKLINHYSMSENLASTSPQIDYWKRYGYDYNSIDPFISSSDLCLSLRVIAGTYVDHPYEPKYNNITTNANPYGNVPKSVQQSNFVWRGSIVPNGVVASGSGKIALHNTGQYGNQLPIPTVVSGFHHPLYEDPVTGMAMINASASLVGTYPDGAFSSEMMWKDMGFYPPYTGSFFQQMGQYSFAYGYNHLEKVTPFGNCSFNASNTGGWTEIQPIIPLTTAHYPTSASHFWITSSYSNNALTFRKPNDRVGSPSLYTLPFVVTASFVPTIYNSDSVFSNNRTVDLSGSNLTFNASNGETFAVNADPSSQITVTGLTTSSYSTLIGYNSSSGLLSSTGITNNPNAYFYSTGSTNDNSEVTNDIKLELGLVYDYDNGINLDNSIYEVNTAGKYYINVNGTLGEDSEPSSNGLGWWKVALQVNGTTVAESTAKQSEVGDHYGGLDLMYVGDFSVSDTIQLLSDTSPSSATSSISNTTYRFSAEYLGA